MKGAEGEMVMSGEQDGRGENEDVRGTAKCSQM